MTLVFLLAGAPATVSGTAGGLEPLAAAERWDRVLEVAVRRGEQLPLRPDEALVAAHAARMVGEPAAEEHFLELALGSNELGPVAAVELAELIVERDPGRALDLVSGFLRRAPTRRLRDAAGGVAERAIVAGLDDRRRSALETTVRAVPRTTRRSLELALATTASPVDRGRLSGLLASSTRDLVALAAAEALGDPAALGELDRWRVAQTLYRHGLYQPAASILDGLAEVRHSQIPPREVAYLRGRCAFRRDDWPTATEWYRIAISRTGAGERRAELEVHLGRTYELAGDMDGAVAAAQRAVRLKTSDDRRLFLARLRLRRGEPELAGAGIARLRSRTARARGELMLALAELRAGDRAAAEQRLSRVDRDPWRVMAALIAAETAAAEGRRERALQLLDDAALNLGPFWAERARAVMAELPTELLDRWRRGEAAAVAAAVGGRQRQRALGSWLRLEPDPARVAELRAAVAAELGLSGRPEEPQFPRGLAAELWSAGLHASAVRWDSSGLPRDSARSTWWTAETELELGRPWLAISAADAAHRQASVEIPARGLPTGLRHALYPLPFEQEVRKAATRHGVPWSLLAGVAREESRWNPAVLSKVGARGLMQLMPATAVATVLANGRPEITPDDLFEPFISLDLGAAEIARLLAVFDGNRAAAVAAYNAGQTQALAWLEQCGEGCTESLFLANVSFSVTRGYTEAVLGSAAAYEELDRETRGSAVNGRNG